MEALYFLICCVVIDTAIYLLTALIVCHFVGKHQLNEFNEMLEEISKRNT